MNEADPVKLTPWISVDDRIWERYANVTCVECPDCCFRFDAVHQDGDSLGYSCPNCNGNPRSTTTPAAAAEAAWQIAKRWIENDLPEKARIHSLQVNQLRVLAEDVLSRYLRAQQPETNYIHLPQYPLNGTQLECDGSELRADGTCAKCERINQRIATVVKNARADAIGECVEMAKTFVPKRDLNPLLRLNQFAEFAAALEQLKEEGNGEDEVNNE